MEDSRLHYMRIRWEGEEMGGRMEEEGMAHLVAGAEPGGARHAIGVAPARAHTLGKSSFMMAKRACTLRTPLSISASAAGGGKHVTATNPMAWTNWEKVSAPVGCARSASCWKIRPNSCFVPSMGQMPK